MIYLSLFWEFFKIGLFTIGGGYAMYPLIRQTVLNKGWLSADMLTNFVGISESTPGPFAINVATFVGMQTGQAEYGTVFAGILGAACTTLGVVLPSLIIIMIIAKLFKSFADSNAVQAVLYGMRPAVLGLILSAVTLLLAGLVFPSLTFLSLDSSSLKPFNYLYLILIVFFFALSNVKIKQKRISPILLILFSAVVGILLFGVFSLS